jgi:hypothetical protein
VRVSLVSEEVRVALNSEDDVRSPEAEVSLAVKEPEDTSEVALDSSEAAKVVEASLVAEPEVVSDPALDSEDDARLPEAEVLPAVVDPVAMSEVALESTEEVKVVSTLLVTEPVVEPEPALDSGDEVDAVSDLIVVESVVVSKAALDSTDEAETVSVVVGFTVVRSVVVVSAAAVADLAPIASVEAVSALDSVDVETSCAVTAVDGKWVSPPAELRDVSEASPDEVPEVSVISMVDEASDNETLPMIEVVSDLDAVDASEYAVSEATVVPWLEVPLAVKIRAPIPPWGCLGLHADDLLTSGLT